MKGRGKGGRQEQVAGGGDEDEVTVSDVQVAETKGLCGGSLLC